MTSKRLAFCLDLSYAGMVVRGTAPLRSPMSLASRLGEQSAFLIEMAGTSPAMTILYPTNSIRSRQAF
jgi:hypothetical protein